MLRARFIALVSVALASTMPGPVFAQDEVDPVEHAGALYDAAEILYGQGRFEEVVELLLEARSLHDEPILSYNLGRAYEELGLTGFAIEAYRHYLERDPEASDRGEVEERVEALEARAARPEEPDPVPEPASPSEEAAPVVPATEPRPSTSPVPWVVAGAGLAVIGTAVTLGVLSSSSRQDAVDDPEHRSARQTFRRAEDFATAANVGFVAGGVLLAVGVTWLTVELGAFGGGDESQVRVRATPTALVLEGTLR